MLLRRTISLQRKFCVMRLSYSYLMFKSYASLKWNLNPFIFLHLPSHTDSYRLIRNSPSNSLAPSPKHMSPQKNIKYVSLQASPHRNQNNSQSPYTTLSRDSSPKHHLIQIQRQQPYYPTPSTLHDPATGSFTGGDASTEPSTTVVTTTTTSNSYFPSSHFQCQTAPHGILVHKQINPQYYPNHQQQQSMLAAATGTTMPHPPHVMHLQSHHLAINDRNDHHIPMQYHTATVHGKFILRVQISAPPLYVQVYGMVLDEMYFCSITATAIAAPSFTRFTPSHQHPSTHTCLCT